MKGLLGVVMTLAVMAAVALLGRSWLRARSRLRALGRQREWQLSREADRRAAQEVLAQPAGGWPRLERLPAGFSEEPAYYAARCTLLAERADGAGFDNRGHGWLIIGERHLHFHPEAGTGQLRWDYRFIERVDSPYVNVLAIVVQDPATRQWSSHWFRLQRPLVAAAYLSRLAGFQLILS